MGRRSARVLCAVTLLTACDAEGGSAEDPGDIRARAHENNGYRLNGGRLNEFRVNGFRLDGFELAGSGVGDVIELEEIELTSGVVQDSWILNGELQVLTNGSITLTGGQLVGAKFHFGIVESSVYKHLVIRIQGVQPLAPGADVLRYELQVDDAGSWVSLCNDSLGAPTGAVLLTDLWDPGTGGRLAPQPAGAVTFACLDAALSKCVQWGYVPWRDAQGRSLRDYHQACTRAVRADYCGDGTPHTVNGTGIHVLDELGIEQVDPNVSYVVEAEWGPNGATCLNPGNTRIANQQAGCSLPLCGASFVSGGLIQTGKIVTP